MNLKAQVVLATPERRFGVCCNSIVLALVWCVLQFHCLSVSFMCAAIPLSAAVSSFLPIHLSAR